MNDTINDFCTNTVGALGKKYSREMADKVKAAFQEEDITMVREVIKVVKAGAMSKDEITASFRAGYSALLAIRFTEAIYAIVDNPNLTVHKALIATEEDKKDDKKTEKAKEKAEKEETVEEKTTILTKKEKS